MLYTHSARQVEHSNTHIETESQTNSSMCVYTGPLKGKHCMETKTRGGKNTNSYLHKHTFPHKSFARLRVFASNYNSYRPVRPQENGTGCLKGHKSQYIDCVTIKITQSFVVFHDVSCLSAGRLYCLFELNHCSKFLQWEAVKLSLPKRFWFVC